VSTLRIVKINTPGAKVGRTRGEGFEVIWKGGRIEDMAGAFSFSQIPRIDHRGKVQTENGPVDSEYAYQQLSTFGGSWLNIGDPRPGLAQVA